MHDDYLLDRAGLAEHFGIDMSRMQINRQLERGEFPKATFISPHKRRWRVGDIKAWLAAQRGASWREVRERALRSGRDTAAA